MRLVPNLALPILFFVSFFTQAQHSMTSETILSGKIKRTDLINNFHWFNEGYHLYKPSKKTIEQLAPYADGLSFIVVMGTWCSDSREHVPPFYQVVDQLHIPESSIDLVAVDRKKQGAHMDISLLKIEYVPTFIVYYKGKEIGRIVEDTKKSIEKDLLELLQQQGK